MPLKGTTQTSEHREKISAALKVYFSKNPSHHLGKKLTPETRKKISQSRIERGCAVGSKNPHFGKHHSDEARKKISEASKRNKNNLGKHLSQETRDKLSQALTGKKQSLETIEKKRAIAKSPKAIDHLKELNDRQKGANHPFFGRSHKEETKQKLSSYCGEKASNWRGGISFEPYCVRFTPEFKKRVRAFFNYQCVECGTLENGRALSVHHVNYDKMVCCNDVKPLFVCLCIPCNTKANYDRPRWEQHFTEMIETHYRGKCYFTKEEMKNVRI